MASAERGPKHIFRSSGFTPKMHTFGTSCARVFAGRSKPVANRKQIGLNLARHHGDRHAFGLRKGVLVRAGIELHAMVDGTTA